MNFLLKQQQKSISESQLSPMGIYLVCYYPCGDIVIITCSVPPLIFLETSIASAIESHN